MSTITKELAKLFRKITNSEIDAEGNAHVVLSPADSLLINNARIALASLEAEPVAWAHRLINKRNGVVHPWVYGSAEACPSEGDIFNIEVMPLYTAPPAPVSVPAAMEMDDDFDSAFEHGKAVGWNACRAAMLQGVDRPQNEPQNIPENIPATQFKPVADLYGLTSPTGGETSFTFDAVEARDFIDGGWSCQEYVELERFQEAITNHTEDKLAMVDHSGDSNNMVEPVTTANKLLDGWVACSERMPEDDDFVYIWPRPDFGVELHVGQYCECHPKGDGWYAQVYEQNYGIEWCPITVTHWMPLPAAPKQELK
ncbi:MULTISPECIES: DUF551 domain-containing protein [Enterobacter cloacae complex]|nr:MULTISPECIES: DUF551 domain-containing protein [Enterobacter cloacae complex]MCM8168088.1 DUF551 domain-containing protein [Enterobacter hormaechei]